MSYEVISRGISIGQFASNKGYADLIKAAKKYPSLAALFRNGTSTSTIQIAVELKALARETKDAGVASTAMTLADLVRGQREIIITDGVV